MSRGGFRPRTNPTSKPRTLDDVNDAPDHHGVPEHPTIDNHTPPATHTSVPNRPFRPPTTTRRLPGGAGDDTEAGGGADEDVATFADESMNDPSAPPPNTSLGTTARPGTGRRAPNAADEAADEAEEEEGAEEPEPEVTTSPGTPGQGRPVTGRRAPDAEDEDNEEAAEGEELETEGDNELPTSEPAGGPPGAPPMPPKGWAKKLPTWAERKAEYGLNEREFTAMQVYTTAAYRRLNGFLRGTTEAGDKPTIIRWLLETGLLSGARIDSLDKLQEMMAEVDNGGVNDLDQQWTKAGKVLHEISHLVTSAMVKWPKPPYKDVYRGVSLEGDDNRDFREKHALGEEVLDDGFMSTAFSKPFNKDSLIVIQLPEEHPGRNISEISKFEQENEILFPPRSGYKIEEVLERNKPDHAERFNAYLKKMVPDDADRENRFKGSNTIYITSLVLPA